MAVLGTYKRLGSAFRSAAWLMLAGLFLVGATPAVAVSTNREYQVKAVFLLNFAKFVEWPPEALPDASHPLIIGVLGEDPFGPALDDVVRGESVQHRPVKVCRYRRIEEVDRCHVLFISASEASRTDRILARLQGRGILTVGDAEGFARRGGMIRFLTENKKIRFRVNLVSVRAAGLVLSSKLLRAAEIVNGPLKNP